MQSIFPHINFLYPTFAMLFFLHFSMTVSDLPSLLKYFPQLDPPVILSVEEVIVYSSENKPLPEKLIQSVFFHFEPTDSDDDFIEFIPCFRLNTDHKIIALIYYRVDLLKNEYNLLTLSEKGKFLDKKAIAGTFLKDDELISSVASIDEDGLIQVVIGSDNGSRDYYNPLNSQTVAYEIAPDGKIILSNQTIYDKT